MRERPLTELLQAAQAARQWQTLSTNAGPVLRAYRVEANVSQSQVAAAMNVSQPYLSQIESDTSSKPVSPSQFLAITQTIDALASSTTTPTEGGPHNGNDNDET